jgi:hypothetical protein
MSTETPLESGPFRQTLSRPLSELSRLSTTLSVSGSKKGILS